VDSIKGIFESLKLTLYEWMAVLLPGIAGVECIRLLLLPIHNVLPGSTKPGDELAIFGATNVVAYLVVAYLAGLAFQGLSSILVGKPVAYVLKQMEPEAKAPRPPGSKEQALKLARSLLREDLPEELLVSFCLSRVDVKRTVYDRFTTLRDMCRALTLVAAIAALAILFAGETRVPSGYRAPLFVAAALATAGLCERYIRYRPLADEALFGLFLSNEIPAPPKP
jgi:hypothetical protein